MAEASNYVTAKALLRLADQDFDMAGRGPLHAEALVHATLAVADALNALHLLFQDRQDTQ